MRQLTPKTIDALPPAQGKRYEVRDALLPGLHLRVSATGGKVFYLSKRVDHRPRRIRIGAWPVLSLHDAREKARSILRSIKLGEFDQDEPDVEEAHVLTLAEVIPQFIELYAKLRTVTGREANVFLRNSQASMIGRSTKSSGPRSYGFWTSWWPRERRHGRTGRLPQSKS